MHAWIDRRVMLLALTLFAGQLTAATAQQATGEPIKIGAILSITGPAAVFGTLERDVLQLSEKNINSKGGVKGRPLQLIFRDDGSNPDTAITHANDLIFGQKVVALLGPSISAPTVAVGGIAHRNKIPQLAYAGFGPPIEAERRCVFHMPIGLELRARALLVYAKSINAKKVGIVHDAGFGNLVQGIVEPACPLVWSGNRCDRKIRIRCDGYHNPSSEGQGCKSRSGPYCRRFRGTISRCSPVADEPADHRGYGLRQLRIYQRDGHRGR